MLRRHKLRFLPFLTRFLSTGLVSFASLISRSSRLEAVQLFPSFSTHCYFNYLFLLQVVLPFPYPHPSFTFREHTLYGKKIFFLVFVEFYHLFCRLGVLAFQWTCESFQNSVLAMLFIFLPLSCSSISVFLNAPSCLFYQNCSNTRWKLGGLSRFCAKSVVDERLLHRHRKLERTSEDIWFAEREFHWFVHMPPPITRKC